MHKTTAWLVAFAISLGAGACLWACPPASGPDYLVNGFEGTSSTCSNKPDIPNWQAFGSPAPFFTPWHSTVNWLVPDPDGYMSINWTKTTQSAVLSVFENTGDHDWSAYSSLRMAITTIDANGLQTYMTLFSSPAQPRMFKFEGGSINAQNPSSVTLDSWTTMVVSLNYAANQGLDLANMVSVSLTAQMVIFTGSGCYDDLALDPKDGGAMTANAIVPSAKVTAVPGCGTITLNWPVQTPTTGADPIDGYHIYRAAAAGGPYQSIGLVQGSATNTFTDNVTPDPNANYYFVLPYSSTTSAFTNLNNVNCQMAYCLSDSGNGSRIGLHEDRIAGKTPAGSYTPVPAKTPVTPQNLTAIGCVSEIDVSWDMPAFTGCNNLSVKLQRSTVLDFSSNVSDIIVLPADYPRMGYQDKVYDATFPGPYFYRAIAYDTLFNSATSIVMNPPVGFIGAVCPATPTPGAGGGTPTATVTPIPGGSGKQKPHIFPNPFSPAKGEHFHLGNISADATVTIYNMVGELVLSRQGQYFINGNGWDGKNNNGVDVVTGVYFLSISGDSDVYKVAVIR